MAVDSHFEHENLIRLVRDYVHNVSCTCEFVGDERRGVPVVTCWKCLFEYNLRHLDDAERRENS